MEQEAIDCLGFGDILELDPNGDLDTLDNIEDLFAYLVEEGKYDLPARTKLKVWGSKINWSSKHRLSRYSIEVVRTLGYLKRYYRAFNHVVKDFDLEEYHNKKDFEFALLEKEGERRAAFGLMRQIGDAYNTAHLQKEHEKEVKEAISRGETEKVEKLKKDFKKRTSKQMLVIG